MDPRALGPSTTVARLALALAFRHRSAGLSPHLDSKLRCEKYRTRRVPTRKIEDPRPKVMGRFDAVTLG